MSARDRQYRTRASVLAVSIKNARANRVQIHAGVRRWHAQAAACNVPCDMLRHSVQHISTQHVRVLVLPAPTSTTPRVHEHQDYNVWQRTTSLADLQDRLHASRSSTTCTCKSVWNLQSMTQLSEFSIHFCPI